MSERITDDGVDRAEVEGWATELGHLEAWRRIVAKLDGHDLPAGPGVC